MIYEYQPQHQKPHQQRSVPIFLAHKVLTDNAIRVKHLSWTSNGYLEQIQLCGLQLPQKSSG
ncbi:hypothetical protein AB02_3162 [Escherichia coli 2-222-05_S1_C1]|nr:hypothetical protein AB02_3162 [Escherichia coli 2-222-05_S1_C1]KDX74213.1 hypothetical protein AB31_3145 [Escherichia coli 2-222-05_S1_C2]